MGAERGARVSRREPCRQLGPEPSLVKQVLGHEEGQEGDFSQRKEKVPMIPVEPFPTRLCVYQ